MYENGNGPSRLFQIFCRKKCFTHVFAVPHVPCAKESRGNRGDDAVCVPGTHP